MPKSKNYWTVKNGENWSVKKEESSRASSNHSTQYDAWKETRRLARGSGGEAILQGRDGKIRAKNSYGYDSFPPRG